MNEQDSQFPGNHWVMVYQDKKNTCFIDSLGRDFIHDGFKFKKTTMFRFKIMWSFSCGFWMKIGKKIKLEQQYVLFYMGLQIQQRVHLRLHQGKTTNSENTT